MSDLLDEAHAQAGLQLLIAEFGASRVFDGKVPDATDPAAGYVLVYTEVAWPAGPEGMANPLSNFAVTAVTTWTLHCVSTTAAGARAVQGRARAALLNQRPVVAGRSCGIIRQDEVLPPSRDETTGQLVMDAVSTYSLFSAPG